MENKETTLVEEKKWEFRSLKFPDVFKTVSLINKLGIKQFKDVFSSDSVKDAISNLQGEDNESLANAVGMTVTLDMASIVIENLGTCEDDIYDYLANVSNLKKEEIMELDMSDGIDMIIDFITNYISKDFMKVVSKFL